MICDKHGLRALAFCLATFTLSGCIEKQAIPKDEQPFEVRQLDACLCIVIDMSSSFADSWDDRAHKLFLQLMDKFFTEGMGSYSRVIIGQLSAAEDVIVFEGTPAELRSRFQSPDELNTFLKSQSDPGRSPVFETTGKAVDYVLAIPGVTERTRILTVVLSDMSDSEQNIENRRRIGYRMLDSLTRYREQGGGLALYFVAQDETARWDRLLDDAGFQPGQFVIENTVVESPLLPRFD